MVEDKTCLTDPSPSPSIEQIYKENEEVMKNFIERLDIYMNKGNVLNDQITTQTSNVINLKSTLEDTDESVREIIEVIDKELKK